MSTQSPHILSEFDKAITAIKDDVLKMASNAQFNLERAIRALLERNLELANSVIADDDEVDELERTIDKRGMQILIKFNPMATDLRFVVSSMKISMNLERIADHAVNIAKRAKKIMTGKELSDTMTIEPIYKLADELFRDSISSYNHSDAVLGASLHARDKKLDELHKDITAQFAHRIEEASESNQEYLHLILVIRSLERIGDLACNIGEDAVYLAHAKDLRHKSDDEREINEED